MYYKAGITFIFKINLKDNELIFTLSLLITLCLLYFYSQEWPHDHYTLMLFTLVNL